MKTPAISRHAAGGHDWIATWRRMYDEEREQAEQITPPGFAVGADFWAGQAGRFASAANQAPQPDGFMQFLLPQLRPTDRLLDIGAGTGRYEPILARAVAELLALEPSAAMRERLEQRIAEEQLGRVQVIAEGWPGAAVPPCDIVIAAHVLYSVREIEQFLRRMDEVAQRPASCCWAIATPPRLSAPSGSASMASRACRCLARSSASTRSISSASRRSWRWCPWRTASATPARTRRWPTCAGVCGCRPIRSTTRLSALRSTILWSATPMGACSHPICPHTRQ